jgi:hypothetical protein
MAMHDWEDDTLKNKEIKDIKLDVSKTKVHKVEVDIDLGKDNFRDYKGTAYYFIAGGIIAAIVYALYNIVDFDLMIKDLGISNIFPANWIVAGIIFCGIVIAGTLYDGIERGLY